jgi:protein SCO1/2
MYKIILTVAMALSLCLVSCGEKQANQTEDQVAKETFTPSEESIFNLASKWENQNADSLQLKYFAGKPTIMAMIYTHCAYSCPLIVADMKELHSLIPKDKQKDVNFLLVSIDPELDRPDTLRQFMKREQMDEKYWTMLTGTETKIRELAAVLGFKYKKTSLMDYAHSNLISVLNPNGEIVEQIDGFGSDKKEIIEKALEYIN